MHRGGIFSWCFRAVEAMLLLVRLFDLVPWWCSKGKKVNFLIRGRDMDEIRDPTCYRTGHPTWPLYMRVDLQNVTW